MSSDDAPFIDRDKLKWKEDDLLGEGSFGRVFLGHWNGTPVAIKVVKRANSLTGTSNLSQDQRQQELAALKQHRREIHRFQVVRNPHIIQYLKVFRDADPHDLYIVTEYLEGGSLHDSLEAMRARNAILDPQSFLTIALHLAYGLNHVHAEKYTHGDVKPQNILLTAAFQFTEAQPGKLLARFAPSAKAKIADFGLSKRLGGANGTNDNAAFNGTLGSGTHDFGPGPCGTLLYLSPEGYKGIRNIDDTQAMASDIYAYGLVLFELLSGLQSWQLERVNNPLQLAGLVTEGTRPSWGSHRPYLDPKYVKLVEDCWNHKYELRPTAGEIIDILNQLQEELKQIQLTEPPLLSSPNFSHQPSIHHPAPDNSHQQPNPQQEPKSENDSECTNSKQQGQANTQEPTQRCILEPVQPEPPKLSLPLIPNNNSSPPNSSKSQSPQQKHMMEPPALDMGQIMEVRPDHVPGLIQDSFVPGYDPSPHDQEYQEDPYEVVQVDTLPDDELSKHDFSKYNNNNNNDQKQLPITQKYQYPPPKQISPYPLYDDNGKSKHPEEEYPAKYVKSIPINEKERQPEETNGAKYINGVAPNEISDTIHSNNSTNGTKVERGDTIEREILKDSNPDFQPPEVRRVNSKLLPDNQFEMNLYIPDGNGAMNGPVYGGLESNPTDPHQLNKPNRSNSEKINSFITAAGEGSPISDSTKQQPGNENVVADGDMNAKAVKPPTPHLFGIPNGGVATNGVAGGMDFPRMALPGQFGAHQNIPNHLQPQSRPPHQDPRMDSFVKAGKNTQNTTVLDRQPHVTQQHPQLQQMGLGANISNFSAAPNQVTRAAKTQEQRPQQHSVQGYINRTNEVEIALQYQDGLRGITNMWQAGGRYDVIAEGLSQCKQLQGKEMLIFVSEILCSVGTIPEIAKNLFVAKNLCMTIGNIARNSCGTQIFNIPSNPAVGPSSIPPNRAGKQNFIDNATIIQALKRILICMHSFSHEVEIYIACNYAFCNLFKVDNSIDDIHLRNILATWIDHSVTWNITELGGNTHAPKSNILAYMALSSVRNFMWMNEKNTQEFMNLGKSHANGMPMSSISHILESITFFFDYLNSKTVVESGLSALAILIQFPAFRLDFAKHNGLSIVMNIFNRYGLAGDFGISRLILSMLSVLLSQGTTSSEMNATVIDEISNVVDMSFGQSVIQFLQRARSLTSSTSNGLQGLNGIDSGSKDRKMLEIIEVGFRVILAGIQFTANVARSFSNAEVFDVTVRMVNDLACGVRSHGQVIQVDRTTTAMRERLTVTLCEILLVLCRNTLMVHQFREAGVDQMLSQLKDNLPSENVVQSCQAAMIKITAAYG